MTPFFRRIRRKLANDNQFLKYGRYAIGEILLVVVGILIALQINNWNEDRKTKNELHSIYNQIIFDLDNDITEISKSLEYYKTLEPVFDKVKSDSRTADLLDHGLSRLTTEGTVTNLNKSGVERLKTISVKESLSLRVIEIYDIMENVKLLPYEKMIRDEAIILANLFRDDYSWYPEWISKTITKDNSSEKLHDYFVNSQQYRHYVISQYNKIYNNYIPYLESVIPELEKIKEELQRTINK